MSPDRWRQIEQLYHSALQREPDYRESFLDGACGGDHDLRWEVERLLQQSGSTGALLDRAELAEAAGLDDTRTMFVSGEKLGPYQILGPLGEGGMGKVYRALDTRLERQVAIKVSAEQFSRRFEREARAISTLNHPHICTLYDVGPNYLVTELVEGETLREWLKGAPSVDRIAEIARQILEALRAAHGAGIVHRDLKPANIMVRFDGYVKVLDFGLAKRIPSTPLLPNPGDATTDLTFPGQIAGTIAYMSPEQIQGKDVDQRSDLFAFGIVFYELLTGRHPWPRASAVDTLHAILHDDVPPIPSTSRLDENLGAIMQKLLRKDPVDRYASAEAVLESLTGGESRQVPPGKARTIPRLSTAWRLSASAAAIAAAAILAWWLWPQPTAIRVTDLTRVTSDGGLTVDPALSSDGKMLTYASDRAEGFLNIWVQQVVGGEPLRVTKDQINDSEPSFSPDGTLIAFRSERERGGIYLVPTLGGVARRIANEGRGPRFSPDGEWVAYWVGDRAVFTQNQIYVVPVKGGEPRRIAGSFFSAGQPLWSPDGKDLLFLGAESEQKPIAERYDWWIAPLNGGAPVATGAIAAMARNGIFPLSRQPGDWARDSILFAGATKSYAGLTETGITNQLSIWRQRLARNPWRAKGKPEQVTTGAGIEVEPSIAADKLALATTAENLEIWMLPLNAETGQSKRPIERATTSSASSQYPAVSRDGNKLVYVSDLRRNFDVYEKDLRTGAVNALTMTDAGEIAPLPNADGRRVMYYLFKPEQKPSFSFWQVSTDGGTPRQVCGDCDGSLYYWSKDERKVIYLQNQSSGAAGMVVRDLQTGHESAFVTASKYPVRLPRLSPDERWVAFQTVVSQSQRKLYLAPVREWQAGPEEGWTYIPDARAPAAWSPSGDLLYFLSDRDGFRCIWAQRLDKTSGRPAGAAFAVLHLHTARRSLSISLEAASIGLSMTADKLFFSMPERTGNVWLAQLEGTH